MMFSIVTLTYQRPELLEESVFSVLQQTCTDWELLIINDCVTQTIHFDHPQVRIFNLPYRFPNNAEKRNFGLNNAFGDWIVQLDDDDFFLPFYLQKIKEKINPKAKFLSCQKPILYSDDVTKIYLSPVPQTNAFFCGKEVAKMTQFDTSGDKSEADSFYAKAFKFKGYQQHALLAPKDCGHVWRQDTHEKRKYSLVYLMEQKIPQEKWYEMTDDSSALTGDIFLTPKWSKNYTEIIAKHMQIVNANFAYKRVEGGEDLLKLSQEFKEKFKVSLPPNPYDSQATASVIRVEDPWETVKPSWSNAMKFADAVKSRGVLATALDIFGISKTTGERVSDEVLERRKLSCFGDKDQGIPACERLKVSEKGSFCASCGCGQKELARLDSDSPDAYTKLHYPQLECPLKKLGFSNEFRPVYFTKKEEVPISIIIPVLNDNEEINRTIQSIYDNSPDNVEIIVIDDGSDVPTQIKDPRVKLLRFNERRGAGQARHFGAMKAASKHLLFTDSHMRFDANWFNNSIARIKDTPTTLWCGSCLGLSEGKMNMDKPQGVYTGADLILYQPNTGNIFDGVWRPEISNKDDYEISCVMGACYFMHKKWYFHIKGLEKTMMWGSEEPILSVKTWLAGGEVRFMKSVRLGHKFRDQSPYATPISHINYNKTAYMSILLPEEMNAKLLTKFPQDLNFQFTMELMGKTKDALNEEKKYFNSIAKHDIYWMCDKFQIELP